MPHVPPTVELQEHAQLLYRRKDYVKALELLNLAISHEPAPSASLLDNRAAVHEKREDYKSALKDARTCIKVFEKDATGYLRAGKVLQKMSKPDVAMSIYKHGISKKAKNADILQKMHDKVLRSLGPAKAADPFAQLPIEIVEMILCYLNFRQIVSCTSVSRQWKTFISSLPGLWMDLDFSESRKPVRSSFLSYCINTSRHKVTSATLKMIKHSDQVVAALARSCPGFTSLFIVDGGLQGSELAHHLRLAKNLKKLKLGPSAAISGSTLSNLLLECEKLTDLECLSILVSSSPIPWRGEFPGLRRLRLVRDPQSPTQAMEKLQMNRLLKGTPNLTSLALNHWGPFTNSVLMCDELTKNLVELDLRSNVSSGPVLFPCNGLPQSLRVLRLDMDRKIRDTTELNPKDFFLPNLEELVCCGIDVASLLLSDPDLIPKWPDPSINKFLEFNNLSKLHTLHVRCNGPFEVITSLLALPRLERLRSLRLTHNTNVNDEVAQHVASTMKSLQDVDLSSTMLTGAGVRSLVNGLKPTLRTLTFINVWHCSADAPEWAREQGVRVSYSQNAEIKPKGRTIRYER